MKKGITLLLTAIMISALISVPVMAEETDLTGTWYVQSMEQDGTVMDASVLSLMGMSITLDLNEDGTAVISNGDEKLEFNWDGENLVGEDNLVPIEVIDGEIKIDMNGGILTLGKEAPVAEAFSMAPVVENPELNDFDGNWNAVTYYALGIPLPMKISMGMEFSLQIKDGAVAYAEMIYDMNNNFELSETIEKEFTAAMEDNGTMYVDFNGEEVLSDLVYDASGIRLTLHEDGKLSGEIPELTESMEMLSAMSEMLENTDAEAADAADATAEEEGASSSGEAMSVYIVLEKAE